MDRRENTEYISGLKGIACILILLGHYSGLVKYTTTPVTFYYYIQWIANSSVGFVFDECFWLYLFFICSGYLLSKSRITCCRELISKCIQRVFRLGVPILFACFFIYLISFAGFYNGKTASILDNPWFQNPYHSKYSLLQLIISPIDVLFLNKCSFNSPYWVLRDMLFASWIIYGLCYIRQTNRFSRLFLPIYIVVLLVTFYFSSVVFSCVMGMAVSFVTNSFSMKEGHFRLLCLLLLIINGIFIVINGQHVIANALFFVLLILFVSAFPLLKNVFSIKPCRFLAKYSWGIYSFHWPILCSAGAWVLITLYTKYGFWKAYAVAAVVATVVTLVTSIIYDRSLGKYEKKVVTVLMRPLSSLLSPEKQ